MDTPPPTPCSSFSSFSTSDPPPPPPPSAPSVCAAREPLHPQELAPNGVLAAEIDDWRRSCVAHSIRHSAKIKPKVYSPPLARDDCILDAQSTEVPKTKTKGLFYFPIFFWFGPPSGMLPLPFRRIPSQTPLEPPSPTATLRPSPPKNIITNPFIIKGAQEIVTRVS